MDHVEMLGESPSQSPLISVVMPVYNASPFLKEAIQSVLDQTFIDFELLLLNDGSTDDSLQVMKAFSDSRISIIENEKNLGLIATLNRGLSLARGRYIARMDADDACLPERFAKQVAFLESHPEIAVLGTNYQTMDSPPRRVLHPSNPQQVREELLYIGSMIAHPTVMLRRDVLEKLHVKYDANYVHAEDYALWATLVDQVELSNLPEILLKYRRHSGQVSVKFSKDQERSSWRVKALLLSHLVPEAKSFLEVFFTEKPTRQSLQKAASLFSKLISANRSRRIYSSKDLQWFLLNLWFRAWSDASDRSLFSYFYYFRVFAPRRSSVRFLYQALRTWVNP